MKVTLVNYTPEPEQTVAAAARMCYSPVEADQIKEKLSESETRRFIRMLVDMGHMSPFEHVSFTFAVRISRVTSHQLVRHRLASYSQQSQRYIKHSQFDYILPPSVSRNPEAAEAYREFMGQAQKLYNRLLDMGIHQEDARYVLPSATATSLLVTMNARELLHFFRLRTCSRAQWEIRAMAFKMLKEVKKVAPAIFEKAGAPCVSEGVCHEGKFSCGRIERLRKAKT